MNPSTPIKPHHFVDIVTALGGGQVTFEAHPYGHAVHVVAERILRDPDVALTIELGADEICMPCKHNVEGACDDVIDTSFRPAAPESKGEWNLLIDRRWCERLGLEQGDSLTARDFCKRLRDRAGNIADIYRENPADRTADRRVKLRAGIDKLLAAGAV